MGETIMIYIKEGNYYTLTDIAIRLKKSKQAIHQRATKMAIIPLKLGRLQSRYHEDQAVLIAQSYGLKLPIDNSQSL